MGYRRRLVDLYQRVNTSNVPKVDGLLEAWVGKEHQLYETVCRKYHVDEMLPLYTGDADSGEGLFGNRFGAFKTLYKAAEELRQGVERSFDEAIRSQDGQAAQVDIPLVSMTPVTEEGDKGSANVAAIQSADSSALSLKGELEALRAERTNLLSEGMRMSKRLHAVESNAKETRAVAARAEARILELEKSEAKLQERVKGLAARADNAEALTKENLAEAKRFEREADRFRTELYQEQRQTAAEQRKVQELQRRERVLQESMVPVADLRRTEGLLERTARERGELLAANTQITAELQRMTASSDSLERRYHEMVAQAEQDAEFQKERLERVELEYATHSMPYMQKIADLEGRLREKDKRLGEVEAESAQRLKEALDRVEAGVSELRDAAEVHKRREEAMTSEAAKNLAAEAANAEVAISSANLAKAAAEEALRASEKDLQRERELRWAEEKRSAELLAQLEDLTTRAEPKADPSPRSAVVAPSADARRLSLEVEDLMKQRKALEQDLAKLHRSLESNRGPAKPAVQLEHKFEAALQCIASLQEELEVCREERDAFKSQYVSMVKRGGKMSVASGA